MPVSVCHQVSTTGHLPPPMFCRYQIQASGLIGSPTLPIRRSDDRAYLAGMSSPHFIIVRISVGAVYRTGTPYSCTSPQKLPGCGVSGVLAAGLLDDVVPPRVAAFGRGNLLTGPADHQHVLHGGAALGGLVDGRLERARVTAPVPTVSRDHDLGVGVLDPAAQRVDREA